MRAAMVTLAMCVAAMGLMPAARAQAPAVARWTDAQAQQQYERAIQLIEAGAVTMPDVGRAGLPLLENLRQTMESLKFQGFRAPVLHYRFQQNLRAWLLIADSVPKPAAFPEQAKKQLTELRDVQAGADAYLQQQMEQLQADVRSPDRDNTKRYAQENAKLSAPASGKPRVVFLGDSITDFWRLNEYFPERDFVNRGISGQITSQMLARFLPDVVGAQAQGVVLLAGTNDIARGVDLEVVKKNITAICDLADHYKIKVMLATLLPVSDYHMRANPAYERTRARPLATLRTLNDWITALAQKRSYVLADYYAPMLDARAQLAEDLADDGLHPNAKGYRLMAPIVLGAIDRAFPSVPAQPAARKKRLFN